MAENPRILTGNEARALATYRSTLRKELNILESGAEAVQSGKFELSAGVASKIGSVFSQFAGLLPVFGSTASAASSLATLGVKKFEEKQTKNAAEKILDVTCGDTAEWNQFTKKLVRDLAEEKVGDLRGLSREEAKKMAQEDAKKIAAKIVNGEVPSLEENPEKLRSILKETATKSKQVEEKKPNSIFKLLGLSHSATQVKTGKSVIGGKLEESNSYARQ